MVLKQSSCSAILAYVKIVKSREREPAPEEQESSGSDIASLPPPSSSCLPTRGHVEHDSYMNGSAGLREALTI